MRINACLRSCITTVYTIADNLTSDETTVSIVDWVDDLIDNADDKDKDGR